ncbi:glutamate receptor ionotropic, delta-2-like [Centruroides vittatus]|uniref:glutamate receptor ionotropic, delta-2-like n=1 Tax=Centruroides vittatus TaxID=120091 RepID=UPI00350E971F
MQFFTLILLMSLFPLRIVLPTEQDDDEGRVIRVAGIKNKLYMKTDKNEKKIDEGQLLKTFNTLLEKANFRYELIKPISPKFGSKSSKTGNWTGVLEQIVNKKADIAFITVFLSFTNFQHMQFSSHVVFVKMMFMVKKPEKLSNWTSLIKPFQLELWLITFITVILCGYVLHKVLQEDAIFEETEPTWSRMNVFWYLFGTFANTGGNLGSVVRFPSRLILSVWLLSIVVLVSSYSGTLVSFMTCPTFEKVPRTVDELADAVQKGEFSCGCMKQNSFHGFLLKTKSKSTISLGHHIIDNDNRFPVEEGIKKVLEGRFAYILDEFGINQVMKKYGHQNFLLSVDSFETFTKAYAFRKDFPYVKNFNNIISHMFDAGLTSKDFGLETVSKVADKKGIRPLMLNDILSPLALLFMGYVLSISCFIAEIFIHKLLNVKIINKL